MTSTEEIPRRRLPVRRRRPFGSQNRIGVWKLAYADFVTAMMAFFMVMWLLTQADLKLRSQIALYFRSPGVLPGGAAMTEELSASTSREPRVIGREVVLVQSDTEDALLRDQAKAIEHAAKRAASLDPTLASVAEHMSVSVTPAGLSIELIDQGAALLFDVSSSDLKPQVESVLRTLAPMLAKLPHGIQIGGHTDARPFPPGSPKSNWQLAFDRADAARRVLEASGVRPGQIERVLSFAASDPAVPSDPLADANRRITILAVRQHPVPPPPPRANPLGDVLVPIA
jgi:chemotaxis protein MotB